MFTQGSTTTTSIYLYDGDNQVEEVDASGNPVARYVQGLGIDEPVAMLRGGATYFYQADNVGTITGLSDSSGNAASGVRGHSDWFGVTSSGSLAVANPFQYTAREFDSETGLYYYRARYYDPSVGRFISEDPIGLKAGPNLYRYVRNDPTDYVDPYGLLQVCCRSAHLPILRAAAWLAGWENPCHCFLRLSNGDTLGGYFDWHVLSFGELTRRQNDRTDHDKYSHEAKCSDVPGSPCANDAKARKAFNALPHQLGDYGLRAGDAGTSNRVVVDILANAGIHWTLPACAWGEHATRPITYSDYPIIGIP